MPPLPKETSLRQRSNRSPGARTLSSVHAVSVPALPGDRVWAAETVEWWTAVWVSPMAPEYDASDLHGLFALAMLVDDFWSTDSTKMRKELAGEIRLQRQCFGLSPIDRRRLEWEVDRAEAAVEQTAKRRASRKSKAVDPDPRSLLVS